jgi:hypothetical protein
MMVLLSSLLAAALAFAQASSASLKPNFSGIWLLDVSRSASASSGDAGEPVKLGIKQTDDEIVIETTRDGKPSTRTFRIDAAAQPGSNAAISETARAYWNGLKLVTEGAGTVQGQTVSSRETLSLNPAGTEMTVERLVVVQHGYSFRGAQNYASGKDVYTRQR